MKRDNRIERFSTHWQKSYRDEPYYNPRYSWEDFDPAYRYAFRSSTERQQLLGPYLHFYNHHRMHSALADQPPISRLKLNNVMRRDS